MLSGEVCAIFFGGVIVGCLIALAFLVGRHYGYWERVEIEKSARGIK